MVQFKDTEVYLYAQRLVALKGKDEQIFKLVLDNSFIKDLVVFLNTDEQLGKQHIDSAGNRLTNRFNDSTTYSLFDPQGRGGKEYRLFDTGEYWESFKVKIENMTIVIESDPIKEDNNLFEMFGAEIEGLTQESVEVLVNEAFKLYIKWYEDNLLPQ